MRSLDAPGSKLWTEGRFFEVVVDRDEQGIRTVDLYHKPRWSWELVSLLGDVVVTDTDFQSGLVQVRCHGFD
jgi:hypothetical protein